jgi:hypothetical protein
MMALCVNHLFANSWRFWHDTNRLRALFVLVFVDELVSKNWNFYVKSAKIPDAGINGQHLSP